MKKVIAIVNQKGGVCKTVSTFTLANIFADRGKKVLMIDMDPQGSLTICAGVDPTVLEKNMYHVMCDKEDIHRVILGNVCNKEGLFLAPATLQLADAELLLVNAMARETILKKAIQNVYNEFDVILVDCPPSLGLLVVNILTAAEGVLIPVSADYLAYMGLQLLLDTIGKIQTELNTSLDIAGIIVTLMNPRTLHAKDVVELLNKQYKILGQIGVSTKVKDAVLESKTIVDVAPEHHISVEYLKIAEVMLNA